MRGSKRFLSSVLIFTVMAMSLPTTARADSGKSSNSGNNSSVSSQTKTSETIPKVVGEIKEKREENIKQFLMDDNSYQAVIYNEPVHYYEDGQWKDIDNTLQDTVDEGLGETEEPDKAVNKDVSIEAAAKKDNKKEKNALTNISNDFKISFAKDTKKKSLVSLKKDDYEISWGIENSNNADSNIIAKDSKKLEEAIKSATDKKVADDKNISSLSADKKSKAKETIVENEKKLVVEKNSSSIQYNNIFTNTDLRYDLIGNKVKENIIINKPQQNVQITFNLNVKNLIPKLQKDNSIIFFDAVDQNKPVFQMAAPTMYDAKQNESSNIDVAIASDKKGYKLVIKPDNEWLNSSDRAFPINVDPPIQTVLGRSEIKDSFVCSIDTENKKDNIFLRAGYLNNIGVMRSYIKFTLPNLSSAEMVTQAQLSLYCDHVDNGGAQINVHKVLADWSSDTLNWSNKPSYNSRIEDYNIVNGGGQKDFDITAIAKDWYNSGNNYGLMLKADNEAAGDAVFRSSDTTDLGAMPRAYIYYVSNTGLESYWTYHSQAVDRAGTGYVNDYNGNLVFVHNDVSMSGNRLPVNINHVYNSSEDPNSDTSKVFGKGWRLNLSQSVSTAPISFADGQYYKYTDEDGTCHYFKIEANTSTYKDESGLNLTLTKNSDGTFFIKDEKDNKLSFSIYGYLQQIDDNQGNCQYLNYNGTRLTAIIDGAQRVTQLLYNSDGRLSDIVEPSGRRTIYQYDNGQLTKIVYSDGKNSIYSYNSNNYMMSAMNYDGHQIQYQYTNSNIPRVNKVLESNIDGTPGQELNMEYGFNTTTYSGIPALFDYNSSNGKVSIQEVNSPDNSGMVTAIKLNKGTNVPVINSYQLNLKPNTDYSLEFDYWADADNADFNVDVYPDDLPEPEEKDSPKPMTSLQHYTFPIRSTSQNMNNCFIRFFNNRTQVTSSNIYIANVKLSEKAAVPTADLTAGMSGGGADVVDVTVPQTQNRVKAVRLNAGYTEPNFYIKRYSLKTNTEYTVEFDYWADLGNAHFNVDLYPDDLPEFLITADSAPQHYTGKLTASSANMGAAWLRFFNNRVKPNPTNIYIANVKIYESSNAAKFSTIREGIKEIKNIYQFNNSGNSICISDNFGNGQYYKYYDKKDQNNKNNVNVQSKLQTTITNYLSNHSFEVNRDWAAYSGPSSSYGSCVFTNEQSYIGNGSVKVTKSNNTNTNLDCDFNQSVQLKKGETYTFSAYVKTSGITNQCGKGAGLFIKYKDAANTDKTIYSQFVSGTVSDWQRIQMTFTVPQDASSDVVYAGTAVVDEKGTAYFDNVQLEKGPVANRYNIVENSNLEKVTGNLPDFWNGAYFTASDGVSNNGVDGGRTIKITGETNKIKYAYQDVMVKGNANEAIIVGGWGKADSVWLNNGSREFNIFAIIRYADGTDYYFRPEFNYGCSDWQYLSDVYVPTKAYTRVTLTVAYTNNVNTAYFDNLQLYKEEFGTTYNYDSSGKIQSVVDIAKQESKFEYDTNNNLIKSTNPNGGKFNYTYSQDTKHNLQKATSAENINYSFAYDSAGNPTETKIGDDNQSIKSTANYTDSKNYMNSLTDSNGNTVTYTWNETRGLLDNLKDPKGKVTSNIYDDMDRLTGTSKTADNVTVNNTYEYSNDRISSIASNTVKYNFLYDSFGNNTKVNVGSQNLITNYFDSRNGKLLESVYGNGNKVKSSYDDYGRLKSTAYNDKVAYKYFYDANGNMAFSQDVENKIDYRYTFDTVNRLVSASNSMNETTSYSYDKNNVSSVTDKIGSSIFKTGYTYDKDNRLSLLSLNNSTSINYSYDRLGRLDGQAINTGISGNYSSVDGVTGNKDNVVTKSVSSSGRYIKLNITNGTQVGADGFVRIPELELYSNPIDVKNKTVEAISSYSDNEKPANVVDGNLSTKWCAGNSSTYYITIDLGQPMDIGKWTVKHAGAGGESASYNTRDFKLQVSTDKVNFSDVDTVTGNTSNVTERFVKTYGRYVRLFITAATQPGQDNFARIYEFSVDGINLALNKTTYSSGANSPIENSKYMVDGLTNTHWCVTTTSPNWVIIDLGNTYTIKKYVLKNAGESGEDAKYNTRDFTLEALQSSLNTKYEYEGKDKISKVYLPNNSAIGYTYDANGNIETITQGTQKIKYYYNELNELVREDNPLIPYATAGDAGTTIAYSYDIGGNIISKKLYPLTSVASLNNITVDSTHTIKYGYTNSNWKDELMSYNGTSITYDAIGNPLTYNGYTYSWQNGRQLAGFTWYDLKDSTKKIQLTANYKYNDSGIRTQKVVVKNGVTTKTDYHLVGDKVTYEYNGTDKIYYTYDASGKLVSMNLTCATNSAINGEYYYVRNAQGDIIGLIDKTGTQVVSYTYDSWGKLISIDGTLKDSVGVKNPYRYRGYRYDTETGLYYLQSRYYNPEWARFINADGIIGQTGELLGHNMFAYCKNNPVNMSDPSGFIAVRESGGGGITSINTVIMGLITIIAIVADLAAPKHLSRPITRTKTEEKTFEIPLHNEPKDTVIYRTGTGGNKNMTPRPGKDNNGLSYTTIMPIGEKFTSTTINRVNGTGKLVATFDPVNPTHVLVNPVGHGVMSDWQASRINAEKSPYPLTVLLQSISIKNSNGILSLGD